MGERRDDDLIDLIDAVVTGVGVGVAVVHVRGEVDGMTAPTMQRALDEAFGLGIRRLLINLADVKFFGSGGMGVLIETLKRAQREGVRLVLVCSSPRVLRPLELCGLSELFLVRESVESALNEDAS